MRSLHCTKALPSMSGQRTWYPHSLVLFHEFIFRAVLKDVSLAIFFGPREKFSAEEFTALKEYMDAGGSVRHVFGRVDLGSP